MVGSHRSLSIPHTSLSPSSGHKKTVRVWIIKTVVNFEYGFVVQTLVFGNLFKGFCIIL